MPKHERRRSAKQNITPEMPRQASLKSLEDLLDYAENYAIFTMRESGQLGATFMILTESGSLLLLPANTANDQEKNESIKTARLVCIAHRATGAVFITEAWMSAHGDRDTGELPSQSPNRKEVVMLLGEAYESRKQKILPILRTESGSFSGFGEFDNSPLQEIESRFSRIIPPRTPTPDAQLIAKRVLARMGVILQDMGI